MEESRNRAEAKCSGQEPTPETLLYAAESYNLGLGMGMEYGYGLLLVNLEMLGELFADTLRRIRAGELTDMNAVIEDLEAGLEVVENYVVAERKETRSPAYLINEIEKFDPKGAMTLRALRALREPQEKMSRA